MSNDDNDNRRRDMLRTISAAAIGILPVLPVAARELGIDSIPWVAAVLAVCAAITRILAIPEVERWLQIYFPDISKNTKEQE